MRGLIFASLIFFQGFIPLTLGAQSSPDEQFNFAMSLYRDGMYSIALEQFRQFADNYPGHARADEAHFMAGECYFSGKEWKKAGAQYKNFLSGYPSSQRVTRAWYRLGECHFHRRYYQEAIEAYDHLFKRYPGSEDAPQAALRIGKCYEELDQVSQALHAYDRFMITYPTHQEMATALYRIGNLRALSEDWGRALASYRQIISDFPGHNLANLSRIEEARTLQASGNLEKARSAYEAYLIAYPKDDLAAHARLGIGMVLIEMKKWREAIDELTKALTLYGKSDLQDNALYQIAEAWRLSENYEQARLHYEELIRNYPRSEYLASAEYGLALTLAEEGRVYAAIEHFEKLTRQFRQTEFARAAQLRIAETYIDKDQFLNGVKAYRGYVSDFLYTEGSHAEKKDIEDERVEIMFIIADVLERKVAHNDMAVSAFLDIVLQFPDHPRAAEAMVAAGRCYEKAENYPAARREYQRIVEKYGESPYSLQARKRIEFIDNYLLQEYDQALPEIASILEKTIRRGHTPDDLYGSAHLFYEKLRMYEEADRLFRSFYEQYPDSPKALSAKFFAAQSDQKLGKRERDSGNNNSAARHFSQAASLYREVANTQNPYQDEAAAQLLRYELDEAEKRRPVPYDDMANQCRGFIRDFPNSDQQPWATFTLGKILTDRFEAHGGDWSEAEILLDQMTRQYPDGEYAAEGYAMLGRLAELGGNPVKASAYYEQTVDYYGTSSVAPLALFRSGELHRREQDYVEAIRCYERLGRDYSFHNLADDAWFAMGQSYDEIRNYSEAIAAFTTLKNGYPTSDIAKKSDFMIGKSLHHLARYAESNEQLQRFIDRNPDSQFIEQTLERAYLLIAENYQQLGDQASAIKTLDRLIVAYPSLSVRIKAADLQFDSGNYRQALQGYRELIDQGKDINDPVRSGILYQVARCHYRLDQVDIGSKKAKDFRKKFCKKNSQYREECARLELESADYYLRHKRFDQAHAAYEQVMRDYPQTSAYAEGQYGVGMYYFSIGDYPASIPIFERVTLGFPGQEITRRAYFRLGSALFNEQRFEEAAQSYQKLIDSDDQMNYPDAHFNYGLSLEKANLWTDAASAYRRFVEKFPTHELAGRAHFKIGYCLFEDGKYREAVDALRFSMDKTQDADKAEAQYWLGEAYFNLGDYQSAAIEFLKVSFHYPDAMDGMWAVTADLKAALAHEKMGEYIEATRLYQKILEKYGRDSQWGKAARERLDQMGD